MKWKIIYAIEAETDIDNIYDYIVSTWKDFNAAKNLARKIITAADSLEQLPLRHQIWNEEPWQSRGIRYFPVENYIIFYMADEKKCVVDILRIIYGGQDLSKQKLEQ